MKPTRYCIFACGGSGTRMGADIPKQFLRLGGKTILQLSIEAVLAADSDIRIVLALPHAYRQFWADECEAQGFDVRQSIVDGGITRFHSVKNALAKVPEDAVVAVHDAVRPFVSVQLVAKAFETAEACGSAVPVMPVTDTVKVLRTGSDGRLEDIEGAKADRSVLFGAQTPQVFRAPLLKQAYEQAYDTSFTDDASVVAALGVKTEYIPGDKYNIKLTTPEDMYIAEKIRK